MSDPLQFLAALLVGFALGVLFFGGLWFTVQRSVTSRKPALWFLASFVFRTSLLLTGFYYVAKESWQSLLICVAGFVIARLAVISITSSIRQKKATFKNNQHETES